MRLDRRAWLLWAVLVSLAAGAQTPVLSMHPAVPFVPRFADDAPWVAYRAQTGAGAVFVARDGEVVYRTGAQWLSESFPGARVRPEGEAASLTRVSRFVGDDPASWQTALPTFDQLSLGEPWPGIEVTLAAKQHSVEKIFTLAPGASARRISVRVRGAEQLRRNADGSLGVRTRTGKMAFSAPVAWQEIGGARRPVDVAYRISGHRYGFELGDYDRRYPVVIDPLLQSTYVAGSSGDIAYAMAVDADGFVYVAGATQSFNLPAVSGGAQPAAGGGGDAFVAKLSRDLTSYVQVTYLGGSANDTAYGLALAADGTIYVVGSTVSSNFPMTSAGAQPQRGGNGDAFVARFDRNLGNLLAATYLGGSGFDQAYAVAIAADKRIYVTGSTASANFPGMAGGSQPAKGGDTDGFVARLEPSLDTLVQATYLGGIGTDIAYAMALDGLDNVFIAGSTGSLNFPGTANGAQPAAGGNGDGFVSKLDKTLTAAVISTYLGGIAGDYATSVAVRGIDVYTAGVTASANFPGTAGGAQPLRSGGNDAFVARLSSDLTTLRQATYLGGPADDLANAIAIDGTGVIYVAGETLSSGFPGTDGGAQASPGGQGDAFAARYNPSLTVLKQATYLGGSALDQGFAVAVDARGHVYVAGSTAASNFPATAGGAQPDPGGNGDATVSKLTASLALIDGPAIEYHHAEWDHYFVTASEDEIAKLDAGVFAGWARTGESFKVRSLDTTGNANICRFFSVSFAPKSSHFYAYGTECAIVKQSPDWEFEGEVFALAVPAADGACGPATVPLYRLYNDGQGGAPNHRYTTSFATREQMIAQGWTPEGLGVGVFACAPA